MEKSDNSIKNTKATKVNVNSFLKVVNIFGRQSINKAHLFELLYFAFKRHRSYGGKGVSEHFRITHNSIVLRPQTIKMVVISLRIIQTK